MLVIVNKKAERDVESKVGEVGIIHSIHQGAIYDYYVMFANGDIVKFLEEELDIIH